MTEEELNKIIEQKWQDYSTDISHFLSENVFKTIAKSVAQSIEVINIVLGTNFPTYAAKCSKAIMEYDPLVVDILVIKPLQKLLQEYDVAKIIDALKTLNALCQMKNPDAILKKYNLNSDPSIPVTHNEDYKIFIKEIELIVKEAINENNDYLNVCSNEQQDNVSVVGEIE